MLCGVRLYAGFLLTLMTIVERCSGEAGCSDGLPNTSAMKRFRDSCYQFVSEEKFWFGARDYCRQNGGRLVRIDDAQTNDFIVQSLNDLWWRNNGVWIGLHDLHGEMRFQWAGVNPYENDALGTWTNWGRGHPGAFLHSIRDCVRMVRENGQWKWHETVCSAMKWHYRFICQYKAQVHDAGVQLALIQHSPVPQRQDNSPSPTTRRPTTAATTTTTAEETTEFVVFLGGKERFVETIPEGESQEKIVETATEGVTEMFEQTLDDEMLVELENFYDNPALAEMKSQDVAMELDDSLGNNGSKGLTLIVFFCSAFALSLILVAVLLIRRRRNQKKVESVEGSDDVIAADKSAKKEESTKPTSSVVTNIYVTDDDIRGAATKLSSRAVRDVSTGDDDVTRNYDSLATSDGGGGGEEKREDAPEMTDDCGMMGYDMPRPTNIYDEIPELNSCEPTAEDHDYESLDDVIAKVALENVIAKDDVIA